MLLTALRTDLDKPAAGGALSAAAALLQTGGLQACQAYMAGLAEAAAKVLGGQAPCQEPESADEADDELETEVMAACLCVLKRVHKRVHVCMVDKWAWLCAL